MKNDNSEQADNFGIHEHNDTVFNDVAADKLNEIPGRQIQPDEIEIRSAVHSNYVGMIAILGTDNRVYLGKQENYDDMGHYYNHDNSLILASDNPDMYFYLYGEGWLRSQEDMLQHGLTMEQYKEFARMQDEILHNLEQRRALLFDGQPFRSPETLRLPENYLLAAEMTSEANYNMLDGRINNMPAPRANLTDGQTHDEIAELAPETLERPSALERPSVLEQLRPCPSRECRDHTSSKERSL